MVFLVATRLESAETEGKILAACYLLPGNARFPISGICPWNANAVVEERHVIAGKSKTRMLLKFGPTDAPCVFPD